MEWRDQIAHSLLVQKSQEGFKSISVGIPFILLTSQGKLYYVLCFIIFCSPLTMAIQWLLSIQHHRITLVEVIVKETSQSTHSWDSLAVTLPRDLHCWHQSPFQRVAPGSWQVPCLAPTYPLDTVRPDFLINLTPAFPRQSPRCLVPWSHLFIHSALSQTQLELLPKKTQQTSIFWTK